MIKQICYLGIAGLLIFASVGFAQYTMELTGVGDGASADGVYVSPYQGTISENGAQIYSGYIICDDFNDEASLDSPWQASASNAGSLNGTQLFTQGYNPFTSTTYTAQQAYDAVAWLANQLVPSNVTNPTVQTNISFAIWDITDGATTDPDGGAASLITTAFTNVTDGYVGSNVTVYTPSPRNGPGYNASQEFLVVSTPEPAAAAILGFDLLSALVGVFLLRRYRVRA
jgi:hypothetical protein